MQNFKLGISHKIIITLTIMACALIITPNTIASDQANRRTKKTQNLETVFKRNVSEYPHDCKLLQNSSMKARLVKLLGQQKYKYLLRNFEVQSPIEYTRNHYTTYGMQAHSGGDPGFTIIYFPYKDNLSIIWHENGRYHTYQDKTEDVMQFNAY